MEMQVRGWRKERVVYTVDTTGSPVPIVTGLTTDSRGREVAVMAHGNGPSVVLAEARDTSDDASVDAQLRLNIAATVEDLGDTRRAGR